MNIMQKRLNSFREKLKQKGFEAALITKKENYFYMSGFTGSSAYLVIHQNKAVLITDFRYEEQATRQASLFQIIKYQGSHVDAVNEVLKSLGVSVLGFEESHLTFEQYHEYKGKLHVGEFKPLGGLVESLRIKKSQDEIDVIKKAVKVADDTFAHILKYIKPGVSEAEVAAEMEYHMKKSGAKGPSFETIIASGMRASMPHGVASEKKLELGDVVTLDFGAIYNEYCSDMTRTVFLGEPGDEIKRIYKIVLGAQLEALKGAKAGLTGKEIDAVAREIIAKNGYGENFGHGLGHGVGVEIHEEPRFSPSGDVKMEDGMVVTVEPGIYVPGLGGVRIEDMIVIQGDQPIILTESVKDIIVL